MLAEEARKVELFNEYKEKCLLSFENGEYEKSVEYGKDALALDIGSDATITFTRGKSLFYLERFYQSLECFNDYIHEYKNSFYRFADISGAYEWKAACLWQLGDGFESIKSYYKAMEYVDKKHCSIQEKMEIRSRINEARMDVIHSSKGKDIYNPRLGNIDVDVYDWIQSQEDSSLITQNLYDAIDEVEDENCRYKSLRMNGDLVCVEFENDSGTVKKLFDGQASFVD